MILYPRDDSVRVRVVRDDTQCQLNSGVWKETQGDKEREREERDGSRTLVWCTSVKRVRERQTEEERSLCDISKIQVFYFLYI